MSQLISSLIDRKKSGKLGHFYVITPSLASKTPEEELHNFTQELIPKLICTEKTGTETHAWKKKAWGFGHPDVLILSPGPEENFDKVVTEDYIEEEFSEFFKFLDLRSFELKHRYLVVYHTHRISERLANKLLKSLEEPNGATTIFFLNPSRSPLLPTIESRAIFLRITPNSDPATLLSSEDVELVPYAERKEWLLAHMPKELSKVLPPYMNGEKNILETAEKIIKMNNGEWFLEKLLLELECQSFSFYETKKDLTKDSQWFQTSRKFHNSAQERIIGMLHRVLS